MAKDPETTELDTAALKAPGEKLDPATPIADETARALGQPSAEEYLKDADEADLTHFEEDDDPTQFAGDPVVED